ncbi:MAG: AAA domain-containing protein, partial [Burkholderiaceae bacterium]
MHAPVEHTGCGQSSEAEAALILELYRSALTQRYTDRDGRAHPMQPANILVVAPYNAQVNLLRRVLPDGAQVGTVDKFQGQEA